MDRMLVVVFDTENKAYEGKKALLQLDSESSISVYACAVIAKNADGTATVKQTDDAVPTGGLFRTCLGSLIGLFGGPVGLVAGATVGLLTGTVADWNNARIGADFVDDVTKVLVPSKYAVVAQIDEDWTTPVDIRMEAIGGIVFRRALSDVEEKVDSEEVLAMKADIAQLKAEHAQARADLKAKLQEKINQLDSKIHAHLDRANARRAEALRLAQVKAESLKNKASALKAKVATPSI